MEGCNYYIIKKETWDNVLGLVEELKKEVEKLKSQRPPMRKIFTNKDIQELLHVNGKLIRKYREEGLLEYSYDHGKYWYTIDNVTKFLILTQK